MVFRGRSDYHGGGTLKLVTFPCDCILSPISYLCGVNSLNDRRYERETETSGEVNFTVKDIDEALTENGVDIEDNVQFVLARKQKCRVIITNNHKDYRLLLGAQIIKPSKVRTIAR